MDDSRILSLLIADFTESRSDLRHLEDQQLTIQRTAVALAAFVAAISGIALENSKGSIILILVGVPLPFFALGTLSLRLSIQHDRMRTYVNEILAASARQHVETDGVWDQESYQSRAVKDLHDRTVFLSRLPRILTMQVLNVGISLLPGGACLIAGMLLTITSADMYSPDEGAWRWGILIWSGLSLLAYASLTARTMQLGKIRLAMRHQALRSRLSNDSPPNRYVFPHEQPGVSR